MAFWSDPGLDPKRQFKFKVTFSYIVGSSGGNEGVFLAQSADRPVYTITDSTKIDYLDKQFHFPGKISWNQVKIKFVDAVFEEGPSANFVNVSQKSYEYLSSTGWIAPNKAGPSTTSAEMKTISKRRAVENGKVKIQVLNSDGRAVDTWTLNNAWVTTVALNNLDYAQEGVLTAEYTFRYDWASFSAEAL